jgi:hypothetical protein
MTSPRAAKATAIAVYTGLRIGLFVLVWLTIELLTPISGVWALVAALLISGALSVVLLDRQRSRMAVIADGFFRGINERIEASARAEDLDEPSDETDVEPAPSEPSAPEPSAPEPAAPESEGSGEGQQQTQRESIDQQ